jgi:glycosyltransferase involved in cell wall biosynthesis
VSRPLVSIGVPTRNRSALLRRTLDMIRAQTYSHLDIVVSDNHSEDDTATVVQAAAARDPRIRYFRQPRDIGLHANLNFCLDHSRGDLLCLFMDDDEYVPTIVAEYVEFLDAHPEVGLLCSDWELIDEEGRILDARDHAVPGVTDGLDYIDRTIRSGQSSVGCPGAIMRRAAVGATRFDPDGPIGFGDFVVWFRIAEAWAIGHIPRRLWRFRVHPGALSWRPVHSLAPDYERNILRYCEGYEARWPHAAGRTARWRRAMRRYLFWALAYELGLDARRVEAGRRPAGGRRTVFEIAGRRLSEQEHHQTERMLFRYRTGVGQWVPLLILVSLLRMRVTTPLAWASRYPDSVRAIFGWR